MAKMKRSTLAAIGRWGMLLPPVVVLLAAGIAKFTQRSTWREDFLGWGYPAWMSDATGVVEILAAALMLVSFTRFYGGALGVAVMVGAAATRLVAGEYVEVLPPLVVAAFAGVTAWWARPLWFNALVVREKEEDTDAPRRSRR